MTEERDDPILDASLEEVLGGAAPPDLSERILKAWRERSPSEEGTVRKRFSRPQSPLWMSLGALALMLFVGVGGGLLLIHLARQRESSVAGDRPALEQERIDSSEPRAADGGSGAAAPHDEPFPPRDRPHDFAAGPNFDGPAPIDNGPADDGPAAVAENDPPSREIPAPLPEREVVLFIDGEVRAAWQEYGVSPAQPATDGEWCRRVYLRLAGRIPTVEELTRFAKDEAGDKRERLIDQLLAGDDFAEYFAVVLTNLLIGRSGAVEDGSPGSREGLERFLLESLRKNMPYDELAFELIAATGGGRPEDPEFNGATNFLLASYNESATLATARTSRVFLGRQVQCVQCHAHPANDWKQHEYWELNAFFRQMRAVPGEHGMRLVNRDVLGKGGDADEAEIYYEHLSGELKVAYPAFDGEAFPHTGLVSEFDRRTVLARQIASSEELSQAAVNRIWSHFFGVGFTSPVDDMGPHNPPSHPGLLQGLSGQFAAHGHDLRTLMRWIALSEPFGLSSRVSPGNLADAANSGGPPLFSRYYTRQMEPEAVYNSLLVAADAHDRDEFFAEEERRLAWMGQFAQSMQTDEGDEQVTFDGAIQQSLSMMNGPLTNQAVSARQKNFLRDLAGSSRLPEEKLERLFLAAVARPPTRRERELAQTLLAMNSGDTTATLETFWWALLNSNEFILDH